MQYLIAGSGTLIIFLITLIGGKKKKGLSDYILIVWLLMFLANIATIFIINTFGILPYFSVKLLLEFSEASIFLHGPVFWFYTLSLTRFSFKLRKQDLFHLIPFLIGYAILVEGIFSGIMTEFTRNILLVFKMLSFFIYILFVIFHLRKHRNKIEDIFSNTAEKYLNWLRFLAIWVLGIWSIGTVSMILDRSKIISIPEYGGLFLNIAFTIFIFIMGYFGFYQSNVFLNEEINAIPIQEAIALLDEDNPEDINPAAEKYKKSGLTQSKAKLMHNMLHEEIIESKPYLNKDLTLFSLSYQLHIQPNHLSQVINMFEGKNFFDFINYYRVNEVKLHLTQNSKSNFSLLGIAYDCGFNSKSSFNRAFKKFTGQTPSEYNKSIADKN
jgi:AraC-like DNA-binding protein